MFPCVGSTNLSSAAPPLKLTATLRLASNDTAGPAGFPGNRRRRSSVLSEVSRDSRIC
ncbi:hypothetical protein DPMN_160996 [Dreissena polymorpha]|uniref:Uncharacterized protein n=1 Tax=Dreissena polymorpha TaxID=45954 RepID=A0A9D4ENW7_DREPO|nr:hypothetical protein DPMN_160996 [Dreissena polymorpha]